MRITKATRSRIREALLKFAFDAHDKAMEEEKLSFFNQIVDFFLPANFLEATRALPDAWFPRTEEISFVLPSGELHRISVYSTDEATRKKRLRKVPNDLFCKTRRYFIDEDALVLHDPLAEQYAAYAVKCERQREVRNQTSSQISSVLNSCTTVQQVYNAFPNSETVVQSAFDMTPPVALNALVPMGRVVMDRLETIRDKQPAGDYA